MGLNLLCQNNFEIKICQRFFQQFSHVALIPNVDAENRIEGALRPGSVLLDFFWGG